MGAKDEKRNPKVDAFLKKAKQWREDLRN